MSTRVVTFTVLVALACGLLGLAAAFAAGVRFFVVATPSMATTAPVGSLVITQPADEYSSGDLIAFTRNERIYTHRIVAVQDGKFVTQGDLNGSPDSQLVDPHTIIGKSIFIGHYLGWVWRAAPLLIMGFTGVLLITRLRWVHDSWRGIARLIGSCLVVVAASIIVRPWFRLDTLGFVPDDRGGVMMHVVNTGVYPIALDGGGRFGPGETAQVWVTQVDSAGRYLYTPHASLGFPGILVAFAICVAPLIIALTMKIPATKQVITRATTIGILRRHRVLLAAAVTLSLIVVSLQLSAIAAVNARITNSTDTARTRTFINCTTALGGASPAVGTYTGTKPIFAYQLGAAQTAATPIPDLTGNGLTGMLKVDSTVDPTTGCANDTPQAAINFSAALQQCVFTSGPARTPPETLSLNIWFKSTTNSNGRLLGFMTNQTSMAQAPNGRHLYIDRDGRLIFGVYGFGSGVRLATSPSPVTDGKWHHAVATMSPTRLQLFLDGVLVGTSLPATNPEVLTGWWRMGCGSATNWQNADGSWYALPDYYTGQLQFAAVYEGVALTQQQVTEIYRSSRP